MYVRLAFAIIAHVDANVLIVDEALAVGDAAFSSKCISFLRKFQKTGVILFVTHDVSVTRSLCNRALWLQTSKVNALGEVKTVCDAYEADVRKELFSDQEPSQLNADLDNPNHNASHAAQINPERIQQFSCKLLLGELPANSFSGGEKSCISCRFGLCKRVDNLIVGFVVRNSLGQTLFGENSLQLTSVLNAIDPLDSNMVVSTEFHFTMPHLISGTYFVTIAISDGTQDDHEALAWFPDVITFRSTSLRRSTGLVGIPMNSFKLEILNPPSISI
jgi:lipopolysaccharide transport system ATP-binding protein